MTAPGANVHVLVVAERFDSAAVPAFKEEAKAALLEAPPLVLDLSKTRFVDSAGLGAMIGILKECNRKPRRMALAGLSPEVRQIFELTRLHMLFDIYESVPQAAASLNPCG